jgi:uncharacterized protein (TIGR00297 family)
MSDTSSYLLLSVILVATMIVCVATKKLTIGGSLMAGLIGCSVYFSSGFQGVCMLMFFFLLSVLATAHRKDLKHKINTVHIQTNGRTAGQVFANGGMVLICSWLVILNGVNKEIYQIMMAGSLASALADTLSSELGMVYGKRYFNILTLKRDINGLDGVVSIEGFAIGTTGAVLTGIIAAGLTKDAIIITLAGTAGNLADSLLGASVERKGIIGNNLVNFLNTVFAAGVALLLFI